jgi:hypothetical protein
MNQVTLYHDDDDGFSGSIVSTRLIKGAILRWTETNGWMDRDGLPPPEILLVLACTEALQRWKDKKVIEEITAKPLPDVANLNGAVPMKEWELGFNNTPKAPWVHQYVIYLIDPASAALFTYLNNTVGCRICFEHLRERVITMRTLRGARVMPMVKPTHRPMKTSFGMKHRPELEIIGWRTLGSDGGGAAIASQTPRLSGPVAAEAKPEPKPATPDEAAKTIAAMGEISVPTAAEELADEIPW